MICLPVHGASAPTLVRSGMRSLRYSRILVETKGKINSKQCKYTQIYEFCYQHLMFFSLYLSYIHYSSFLPLENSDVAGLISVCCGRGSCISKTFRQLSAQFVRSCGNSRMIFYAEPQLPLLNIERPTRTNTAKPNRHCAPQQVSFDNI